MASRVASMASLVASMATKLQQPCSVAGRAAGLALVTGIAASLVPLIPQLASMSLARSDVLRPYQLQYFMKVLNSEVSEVAKVFMTVPRLSSVIHFQCVFVHSLPLMAPWASMASPKPRAAP